MASQKDQGTDPLTEKQRIVPLKKRIVADDNKETFQKLQTKAFYAVLQALTLETSTMTERRSQLIDKLVNEWEIPDETKISIADNIQEKLLTVQQMEDSSHLCSTIVPTSAQGWGNVNPESLIGKWVCFRMPGEADFEEYIINAYDAKEEMHILVSPDLDSMEVDDNQYILVDLREIEDIMWEGGEKPNFNAPNQFAAAAPRALCNFANANTRSQRIA